MAEIEPPKNAIQAARERLAAQEAQKNNPIAQARERLAAQESQQPAPEVYDDSWGDYIQGIGRSFAQGATFNFGDEIEAGINAVLFQKEGEDWYDAYEREVGHVSRENGCVC